jgi:hypothetical protein
VSKKLFTTLVWFVVVLSFPVFSEVPHGLLGALITGMSGGRPVGPKTYPGVVRVRSARKTNDPKVVAITYCIGLLIRTCLITSRHCLAKDALYEEVFRGPDTKEAIIDSRSAESLPLRENEAKEGSELVVAQVLGPVEGARPYEATILASKAAQIPVQNGDPQEGDRSQGKTATVLGISWRETVRPAYDKFPLNLTEEQFKELKTRDPKKQIKCSVLSSMRFSIVPV